MSAARHVLTVDVQGDGSFCGTSVVHIGDRSVVCRVSQPEAGRPGPRYECSVCGQPERSCSHLRVAMGARRLLLGDEATTGVPVEDHQAADAEADPPVFRFV